MARRRGTLLRQLTVGLALAIVFLSLASFYYQYQVEKNILIASIESNLVRQAGVLRTWLAEMKTTDERRDVARHYVETISRLDAVKQEVVIVDGDGKVLAATAGWPAGQDFGSELLRDAMQADAPSAGKVTYVGRECTVALPCYADPAGRKAVAGILMRQPMTAVERLADSLMLGAFVLLVVTLVIIVAVVHVVLRLRVHKPMQAIFMQEYRIREGDLARIEAEDPGNEFSDLYAMYNEMVTKIAEHKRAILEQKDHVALAQLVRQVIPKLAAPLDDIAEQSRSLLEHESSLAEADRAALRKILNNVTRIAKELKTTLIEGSKSATWLKQETDRVREYTGKPDEEKPGAK